MLVTILLIVLIIALVGSFPSWPHSQDWGPYPSGVFTILLIILIVLMVSGRV